MSFFKSRRRRRILIAIGGTALGIAVLTGLAFWLEIHRETDLADPAAKVTSRFKDFEMADSAPIRFRDVAESMGVIMHHGPGPRGRTLPEDTGSGIAWGDYDGDGDWDLYVVNFSGSSGKDPDTEGANHLFRNDGDRFTDVTRQARVGDLEGFGMGATFADYDDDGDVDLYVSNFGPNRLYQNRGDGTFEEVAAKAGVADAHWSTGVTWGDFNRDGHLDLYVCNYVDYDDNGVGPDPALESGSGTYEVPFTLNPNSFDPQSNRLYRNRGDGTFEDVAEQCGVDNLEGRSLGATFCDLDGDGWLDLYVNNDASANKLFRNMTGDLGDNESILFADQSAATGTADPRGSMGLSVGEIGGMTGKPDSLPDLFVSHWLAQENAFYQSVVNSGGGLEYRDKTRHFRLGEISIDMVGWGTALADFDLDGRLDIAVANGSTLEQLDNPLLLKAEPVFIFWNGGKRFHNVAPKAGEVLVRKYWGRGLAVADFDRDGDVDLAIAVNRGQPLLLRNETLTTNQSLVITLRGSPSVCFGAKVEVYQKDHFQVRWSGADVTFMGMHAAELIFGLGENRMADKVKVKWADGKETTLIDVVAGRREVDYQKV
ncbi:MAG TPA: CRTAC1 family protein [Verrucomicrobiales bacterium]|nr:CRTAC1 family protein [Verrucomicrobiales bacterium]